MDPMISKLLQDFANTPGKDYILSLVAEEMVISKIVKLSPIDMYAVYLTIIAFPNRSIKHGKILLRRMLDLKTISDEYLQKELVEYRSSLPEWAQEVFNEKFGSGL